MIKDKYSDLKELRIERIKHRYHKLIQGMQTFQTELKNFLIEDAVRSQDMCISSTYLVFDQRDFRKNQKKPKLKF